VKRRSRRRNIRRIAAFGLIFGLLLLLIVWRIWPVWRAAPTQPALESTPLPPLVLPPPVLLPRGQPLAPPQADASDSAAEGEPKSHALAAGWEMEPDPGVWDVSWQPPPDFIWRCPQGVDRDARGRLTTGYLDCVSPGTLCPFVAVSLPDQSFDVLNLATGQVLQRLGPFAQPQRVDPALSPDGKRFAVLLTEGRSLRETKVVVYSVDSGQQQQSVPVRTPSHHYFHASTRFPLCFAGDEHLLLRNRDWLIRIDLTQRRMGPAEPLAKPGFEPNGPFRIPCERGVRALSPGGRYLVTRDADGRSLHVLDIPTWRMVADIPLPGGVTMFWGEVGFSPDGRRLAYAVRQTGPKDGLIQELDVTNGQTLCSVDWIIPDPPHMQSATWHDQNPLNGLDFLPGEAGWLITGNYVVARGSGHAGIFSSLRFSVADRRVYREDAVRPCIMPDASLFMESRDSQGLSLRCIPLLDAIDDPDCRLALSEAAGTGQPADREAAGEATDGAGPPDTETQPVPEAIEPETIEPLQGTSTEATRKSGGS
jgi:hypothetical protein